MRRRAKVDRNQSSLVDELRQMGYGVALVHTVGNGIPDLVVCGYSHRHADFINLFVEVKRDGKAKHTLLEQAFKDEWKGPRITAVEAEDVQAYFERGL